MAKKIFTVFVTYMTLIQNVVNIAPKSCKSEVTELSESFVRKYNCDWHALHMSLGVLSKQDLKIVHFYEKLLPLMLKFKRFKSSAESYWDKYMESFKEIYSLSKVKQYNDETEIYESTNEVITTPDNVKQHQKRKLKRGYRKYTAYNNVLSRANSKPTPLACSQLFNTNSVKINPIISCGIQSLEEKVILVTGEVNKNEYKKAMTYLLEYLDLPPKQAVELKFQILSELKDIYNRGNPDFLGNFSNQEINTMRKLLIKSLTLDELIEQHGLDIKNLELLMYSSVNKEPKVGDYINGIGLVTDIMSVDNKPVMITAQPTNQNIEFRMYDLDYYREVNEFINSLPEKFESVEEMNAFNKLATSLINRSANSLISEISYYVVSPKEYVARTEIDETNKKEFDTILNNHKYAYLVADFYNYEKRNYPSAAKVLAIRLLTTISNYDKNCPVFAIADNKKKSPVSMYLKIGFKPLSKSEKYVLDNLNNNHSAYVNEEPLHMYLPNIGAIRNKLDLYEQLYFKDSQSLKPIK